MILEDRLVELETKLAFQEDTLQELNNVIVGQQRLIDELAEKVRQLEARLKDLQPSLVATPQEETPPPHY